MTNQEQCGCWRCWFQASFSALILFALLLVSFIATITLMHEEVIADKYVIWLEGWDAGILASLAVALKTGGDKPHHPQSEVPPVPPQENA